MPGAWELRAQRRVLCAVLHTETTTIAWAAGFRNLIIPGQISLLSGMPYDMARNQACAQTLQHGFDHCFFLDSDVVPPHDAILRLLAHNLPIISGVYHRRSPPHGLPVMIKGGTWVQSYHPNTLMEVDHVGAGCLLMRRDLLEKMRPIEPGHHWFCWRADRRGTKTLPDEECLSEDFVMCRAVKQQLGIPIMVDTSVQCRHIGYAQAMYGSMVPCDMTPVT